MQHFQTWITTSGFLELVLTNLKLKMVLVGIISTHNATRNIEIRLSAKYWDEAAKKLSLTRTRTILNPVQTAEILR